MPLKLADPDASYAARVEVDVPLPDGGTERHGMDVRFRLLADAEVDALVVDSQAALLERALAGWDGVEDHDGTPLPCTPENVTRLCGVAYWRRAVVNAYMRFVAGLPAKN